MFCCLLNYNNRVLPSEFDEKLYELRLDKYLFIFLFVVIIGSFSGTTNGGLKLNKLALFFVNFKEELNKFLFQHNVQGVNIVKKGSSQIELNTFYALIIFIWCYFFKHYYFKY